MSRKGIFSVLNTIKSIQAIDRKKLSHTEKNLLIAIAIDENASRFNNEELGKLIGENKDYVKNLLMRLKRKKYLRTEGRGKNRQVFSNYQLPNSNSELPNNDKTVTTSYQNSENSNSELPNKITPIIYKRRYKERRNVVVSISEKYCFKIDDKLMGLLIEDDDKSLIDLFEYTKNKKPDNPNAFMYSAKINNWNIPEYKDPYEAERKRIEQLRSESMIAKNLGFKTVRYAH